MELYYIRKPFLYYPFYLFFLVFYMSPNFYFQKNLKIFHKIQNNLLFCLYFFYLKNIFQIFLLKFYTFLQILFLKLLPIYILKHIHQNSYFYFSLIYIYLMFLYILRLFYQLWLKIKLYKIPFVEYHQIY